MRIDTGARVYNPMLRQATLITNEQISVQLLRQTHPHRSRLLHQASGTTELPCHTLLGKIKIPPDGQLKLIIILPVDYKTGSFRHSITYPWITQLRAVGI
jgi:hypothetical protein